MAEHTAREVVKILKKNGFRETAIHGDHHKFINAKGIPVIVPYTTLKSNVAIGTYNAILHQAGLK